MELKRLLFIFFTVLAVTAYATDVTDGPNSGEGSDSGSYEADCRDSDESSGDASGDRSTSNEADSWESSFEDDEETCEELTEGAEENDGECDLIAGLEIIAETITIIEQKEIFIQFIQKLKLQLSIKVDITIIATLILEFQEEYPECWELVAYKNITTTGFVFARYTKIVIYKQTLIIEKTYIIDEFESCPLIEAFLNFSAGIEILEIAAQDFVEFTLRPFLMNCTLSKEKRIIAIAELIIKFCESSTEYRAFYNAYIIGFGSIRSFVVCSQTYIQLRYTKYVFRGTVESCVLITVLQRRYEQLIIEGRLTIATQISAIIEECKVEFTSETSFIGRLIIFVKIVRKFCRLDSSLYEEICKISIPKFGCIFDLIHCIIYWFGKIKIPTVTTPSCSCTCY